MGDMYGLDIYLLKCMGSLPSLSPILALLDEVQKSLCTTPGVGVGVGVCVGDHIYLKVCLTAHIF